MESRVLLEALEQQLLWLQKQKHTYLNLEPLSYDESQSLNDYLQTNYSDSVEDITTESEYSHNKVESLHKVETSNENQQKYIEHPPAIQEPSPRESVQPAIPETLEELNKKFSDCQRCPLGSSRINLVFGMGSAQSPIIFVGEGPGAEEDRLGEPFVGKAGKLLTQMIQAIGIDRSDVYISNVVKCRPPQNRNPTSEEIIKCSPILQRQIELVNPRLIVTLGNVPTRTLIQSAPGITKARGQIFYYQKW